MCSGIFLFKYEDVDPLGKIKNFILTPVEGSLSYLANSQELLTVIAWLKIKIRCFWKYPKNQVSEVTNWPLFCVWLRSSKQEFEKYCAPLLHLAGIAVNLVQTEHEGQARSLVESLDGIVDAIVVAGGDGTLSEVMWIIIFIYKQKNMLKHNSEIAGAISIRFDTYITYNLEILK